MRRHTELPVFAQGKARVKSALQASFSPASKCKHPGALLDTLRPWSDSYLQSERPDLPVYRSLADFGYTSSPQPVATLQQLAAVAQVSGLFSEQGITELKRACYQLEAGSSASDWIISGASIRARRRGFPTAPARRRNHRRLSGR